MSEFEGQEKLEELRKKDPSALSEADRAFLTARRSYLHAHERLSFGIPEDAVPETDDEEGEDAPKPSKGLTKAQLQQALTEKGIAFAEDGTKAHLAALLDGVSDDEEDVTDEV